MYFEKGIGGNYKESFGNYADMRIAEIMLGIKTIPCWSLASLLSILPEKYTELIKEGGMYRIIIKDSYMTCLFDNPVDACMAMIERLHELNLL